MIDTDTGRGAAMIVLAFVGLIACGVGVLELRLWFRPWAITGARRDPQPSLLGGVLWILVGGLFLYGAAALWFGGSIP